MKIEELQQNLLNTDQALRIDAVHKLLALANHESYGLLMFAAYNHFDEETRHQAKNAALTLQARLFGAADAPSALDAEDVEMIANLGSKDPKTRDLARETLAASEEPETLSQLLDRLQQETDPTIVSQLVLICAELGGNQVFPVIAPFLRSGSEKIRQAVLQSFRWFERPETHSLLIRFCRDSSAVVQQEALKQLQSLPEQSLLETLQRVTQKDSQPIDKEAAIYVIAKLSLSKAFPALKALSADRDSMVAKHARQALAYLEKTKKVSPAVPVEVKQEPVVVEASAPVEEEPVPSQVSETSEEEQKAQEDILKRIRQAEEKEALAALFKLMESNWFFLLPQLQNDLEERNSRRLMASYVMAIGTGRVSELNDFVLKCLEHPDGRVQANAIESLRLIGLEPHREKIIPLLGSKTDRTRCNAIRALHPYGMVDTVKELKEMLASGKENRQLSAIYVISDLLEPHLVPLLEVAMDFPNPKVTKKAMETLRIYILKGYPEARQVASNWGILADLEAVSVTEPSEAEPSEESIESALKDLEKSPDSAAKKATAQPVLAKAGKSEPSAGMGRLTTLIKGLFKAKGKE